jgi:hypothetical protein
LPVGAPATVEIGSYRGVATAIWQEENAVLFSSNWQLATGSERSERTGN